ncbi:MAG: M1 family metallopeptidase [Gemmatimonadales bacterium]
MMRYRLLVAAFLAAAPLSAQQAAFHVTNYDLLLTLPDTGRVIGGVAALTVVRRARSDTLVLDLLDLKVERVLHVTKDPTPTELPFVQDSAHVRVFVGRLRSDTFNVVVYYAGAVRDGLIVGKDSAGRWMAFGDNWPNRARHWIPSIDHPSEKATVSLSVFAPANRTVVANGTPFSQAQDSLLVLGPSPGVRYKMTRWRESHPIPVYLFTIAAAPLEVFNLPDAACGFTRGGGCLKQMVYTAPEQHAAMPANFKYSPDIVDFLSHLVAPFPYEKLAHLQSSTRFGGMENASAIFYADGGFRRNGTNAGTIAHETAHQWFGDAVTEREWSNLWLSEGFATYFEELWTRHAFGDSAFRREMAGTRTQILRDPVIAARPVIDSEQTDLMKLLDANSYQKGGWTLHMLRGLVGDSAFFRGIRDYYTAHVDRNAMSDDLMNAMERRSGMKLQWFFDQWLRRPGFASLATSWRFDDASRRVVLDVEQGVRFAPYRFPLTVDITDATGTVHRVRVDIAAEHSAHVTLPLVLSAAPRAVVLDPDVELLAEFHVR